MNVLEVKNQKLIHYRYFPIKEMHLKKKPTGILKGLLDTRYNDYKITVHKFISK